MSGVILIDAGTGVGIPWLPVRDDAAPRRVLAHPGPRLISRLGKHEPRGLCIADRVIARACSTAVARMVFRILPITFARFVRYLKQAARTSRAVRSIRDSTTFRHRDTGHRIRLG